jgi:hypothetical protein
VAVTPCPKPTVQVFQVFLKTFPVCLLRDAVHAHRRVGPQPVKRARQRLRGQQMGERMEPGGRLLPGPFRYLHQFR